MPEPWWGYCTFWLSSEPPSGESSGGGERDRTDDLLLAKQALSQLSYTPVSNRGPLHRFNACKGPVARWWVWMDSNHRPPPYQDGALTG